MVFLCPPAPRSACEPALPALCQISGSDDVVGAGRALARGSLEVPRPLRPLRAEAPPPSRSARLLNQVRVSGEKESEPDRRGEPRCWRGARRRGGLAPAQHQSVRAVACHLPGGRSPPPVHSSSQPGAPGCWLWRAKHAGGPECRMGGIQRPARNGTVLAASQVVPSPARCGSRPVPVCRVQSLKPLAHTLQGAACSSSHRGFSQTLRGSSFFFKIQKAARFFFGQGPDFGAAPCNKIVRQGRAGTERDG